MERSRSLVAGGDMFLCRDLPGHAALRGAQSVFSGLAPLFERADAIVANLETVIANEGSFTPKGGRRPYYYHAPPESTNVLVSAGIGCVTTANNHSMDFGPAALLDQICHLDAANIAHCGSGENLVEAMRPAYLDASGLTVAVISFECTSPARRATGKTPGTFHVSLSEPPMGMLSSIIKECRSRADLVLVSPHWGPNHREMPLDSIRTLARGMIELGADCVLGHSAHVLQGVEIYSGRPIVYDMGTLVFDRSGGPLLRCSAVFELQFSHLGAHQLLVHPVRLMRSKTELAGVAEARESWGRIMRLSARLNNKINWRAAEGRLALDLTPGKSVKPTIRPGKCHSRKALRYLQGKDQLERQGTLSSVQLPGWLASNPGLDMGAGLRVCGYRRVSSARLGYGFFIQVAFRCAKSRGLYWRATARFRHVTEKSCRFSYDHPVAEGLWLSSDWHSDEIIVDSFVVRPPREGLLPGRYKAKWTLVNMASGRRWPDMEGTARAKSVDLGIIELAVDGPKSVAGVNYNNDLDWVALDAAGKAVQEADSLISENTP